MRKLVLSVMLIIGSIVSLAQTDTLLTGRIIREIQAFPQEKTYVHTDATDYQPGDRVWLKIYVVDALSHEPTDASLYAYVELLGTDSTIVASERILCREGIYSGYIDIPQQTEGGTYLLRSYTELSKNVPSHQSIKALYVHDGKSAMQTVTVEHKDSPPSTTAGNFITVRRDDGRIWVSADTDGDSLTLLAHCRAYPFYMGKITTDVPVVFSTASLPQGVISLLLLDRQLNIVGERLIFSDNGSEECRIGLTTEKPVYYPSEKIALQLDTYHLHEGELADVSISVTGPALATGHQPSSIISHLMLGSDITPPEPLPERYIENADSLLASLRWTRRDMDKVLHGKQTTPSFQREVTHTLSGHVRTLIRHRPVAGAAVSLISPQAGIMATTNTDSEGRFQFPGMDYPQGTQYVLQAQTEKGRDNVELTVEEPEPMPLPAINIQENDSEEGIVKLDFDYTPDPQTIMLDEVEVAGIRRNSASKGNVYAQMADFSFGLSRIEDIGATCLHELLRHIPGVRLANNQCYIRAATSIYDDNPAAIAIDGVIVHGDYDLDIIQMQDVARVDVFKTGTTVIWGSAGGSGVISITTKTGTYGDKETLRLNQKKVSPRGYQKAASFRAQRPSGKTLYWCPNVTADKLTFTAPGQAGSCRIVLEGVTNEGRLIHEETTIEITN